MHKLVLGLWCFNATKFQQYFSYILAVSFIGGGNWSARRKALGTTYYRSGSIIRLYSEQAGIRSQAEELTVK